MARQKNRGYQEFSPLYSAPTRTVRRWNMGGYIRLSREDLKRGSDDSNSVKNQRDLLRDFYQKHIDEFSDMTEYVDATCIIGTNQSPARGRRFVPTFFVFSTLEAAKG